MTVLGPRAGAIGIRQARQLFLREQTVDMARRTSDKGQYRKWFCDLETG
jgi:hypothetical protein